MTIYKDSLCVLFAIQPKTIALTGGFVSAIFGFKQMSHLNSGFCLVSALPVQPPLQMF